MDLWNELGEKAKALAGSWPSYVALGSFTLYLFGYLALRFHLTALGVGTDLAVLDERYLFAGAKFLVYLFTIIPTIVLLALLLVVLLMAVATLVYYPYRMLSSAARRKSGPSAGGVWGKGRAWLTSPDALALAGIVVSLMLIQLVMRHCFYFSNLLLADGIAEPDWIGALFTDEAHGPLRSILLQEGDGFFEPLHFSGLVAGVVVTAGLLLAARSRTKQISIARMLKGQDGQSFVSKFLTALLTFLVVTQFLLLPVNYGVLVMDKVLPQVADLGGQEQLKESQEAWLVWEGTDGVTYLVRSTEQNGNSRKLVTLPRKDVKRTEIIRYDPILRCLFADVRCSQ